MCDVVWLLIVYQGSDRVIQQYDGNVIEALQHVYPELEINHSRFVTLNRMSHEISSFPYSLILYLANHWLRVENRIAFFMEFAKDLGFDPLIADNWHSLDYQALMRYKVFSFSYHSNKRLIVVCSVLLICCLIVQVWPRICCTYFLTSVLIKPSSNSFLVCTTTFKSTLALIHTHTGGYWIVDELQHKRNLFLEFAKEKRFDPLVANNWYLVSEEDVLSYKVAGHLDQHHRHPF